MWSRFLPAFVLIVPVAFGQSGIYGPVTGHPKAGDTAPDLVYSQVLSAPAGGSWSQANLAGQVTVLGFFPDTSHNPQPVADWNERVEQFAGRHVQFVWITGEDKRTLTPALAQHPIKGWVLYDPEGSTARAFGLDKPVNVFVGANRRIVGFQEGYVPDEPTLNAVLEGRVVLTRPTPATITSLRANDLVALDSVPAKMARAEDRTPHIAPSYTVHIKPSAVGARGNSSAEGDDYWALDGFTLKGAIERIYGVTAARIELPLSLDTAKHYDFAIRLPHAEQREEMKERFEQGLEKYFHLTAERETRMANVYVVSRDPGREVSLEKVSDDVGSGSSNIVTAADSAQVAARPQKLDALFGVAEDGATMDSFCRDLEGELDRPVVNETHLDGRYRFQVHAPLDSKASFATVLRERTGLVIGPGQRKITFLKFKVDERGAEVGAVQKR